MHPPAFETVYLIVTVPAAIPVTTPVALTVAVAGVKLLHTPPVVASVNVVVFPTQTVLVPPIAAGEVGAAISVTVTLSLAVLSQVPVVWLA